MTNLQFQKKMIHMFTHVSLDQDAARNQMSWFFEILIITFNE